MVGKGPTWLFDLDYLTDSMNYQPVTAENKANKTAGSKEANHSAGTQDNTVIENSKIEGEPAQEYCVLPMWSSYTSTIKSLVKSSKANDEGEKSNKDTGLKTNEEPVDKEDQAFLEELKRLKRQENKANDAAEALRKEFAQEAEDWLIQAGAARATGTNTVNTVSIPISIASPSNVFSTGGPALNNTDQDDSQIPALKDIYDNPSDGGAVADFTNLESTMNVSLIPTSRIHSIHPITQILGDPKSAVQTRSKVNKSSGAHAFVSYIQKQRRNNHKDFQHCLFACFISQIEPKKISEALEDENLPYGKKVIGTKWVYRNKKDKRGVVVRNKARLVAHGYRQEEGIDYDVVFALVARIEAIRIFWTFASYMGFIFLDPKNPNKVYKVVEIPQGLSPSSQNLISVLLMNLSALMKSRFQMEKPPSSGLQVKQKKMEFYKESFSTSKVKPNWPLVAKGVIIRPEAYSDRRCWKQSDRKSTIGVCQFSWQETYFMALQEADNCGYCLLQRQNLFAAANYYRQFM
ncbi:putative ribonuclease H-like domain-containing protein [Tanacetum coccineum]|uniref:Ribonuclease H-like domain-containing protein n=1 Tax=Tanacetum coccineum TaxID=301880 RepID=A0ABQ4WJX8_9ASTR